MATRNPGQNDGRRFGEVLVALSRSLGIGSSRLERALETITEVATAALDVDRCGVWRLDEAGDRLVCLDLYLRAEDRHVRDFDFAIDDYARYFRALDGSRVIAAVDARSDPRTSAFTASYLDPQGVQAMLDAPIRMRGEIVGVICNEVTSGPREWTESESSFAASVGDLLAMTFEAAEREELQRCFRRSQKLEAVGRLAGGVAHDFNNILTAIQGNVDLIETALRESPDAGAALKDELDAIRTAITRAAGLTNRLLTFSGRRIEDARLLDANEVVAGMQTMLERLLPETIRLEFRTARAEAPIRSDPSLIEQVILNLVLNARDAMPAGGRLQVASGVETTREGAEWRLQVRDEGVGIQPGLQDLIFEPFFTTKEDHQGSGLGLATVLGISKSLRGHVEFDSHPGQGSIFTVRIPLAEAAG